MDNARLTAAVVAVLLLASCGPGGAPTVSPTGPPTDGDDVSGSQIIDSAGDPITTRPGEVFAVRVSANPSVGYEWDVVEPTDAEVVEHLGFFYVDEGGEQPDGASVLVDYRFEAVAPGSTTIVLQQSYRGEVENPPVEQVHEVTVTDQ